MTTTTDIKDASGIRGDATIVERVEQHRYELHLDGQVRGLAVYCDQGDVRAIIHTEVDERVQGRGYAGELMERALADIARDGRRVNPACGYAAWYIEQHPEYQRLVA
ncbi:GNAT family N-acetyltransferase [Jatrophihabitans sp. YIM 134969]